MTTPRFLIIAIGLIWLSACNRHATTSTGTDSGYTYEPTKSTDPFVFNSKPEDVPPPIDEPDTVIVVVEVPPSPPVPPTPHTQADPFAQPEPWMTPASGTYLVAKIKRTPCYGTCPTYTAAIFSDGTAFYFGERFVENLGYFQGHVGLEQLNGIIKMSYQNGFYGLASAYPLDGRYITDLPTTILHLNSSINQKTITDKGNAPEELDVLEEAIHTLLNSIQWKPIK